MDTQILLNYFILHEGNCVCQLVSVQRQILGTHYRLNGGSIDKREHQGGITLLIQFDSNKHNLLTHETLTFVFLLWRSMNCQYQITIKIWHKSSYKFVQVFGYELGRIIYTLPSHYFMLGNSFYLMMCDLKPSKFVCSNNPLSPCKAFACLFKLCFMRVCSPQINCIFSFRDKQTQIFLTK